MPLIAAAILYGGSFFGYCGHTFIQDRVHVGYAAQQHWLELKKAAADQVAKETLNQGVAQ